MDSIYGQYMVTHFQISQSIMIWNFIEKYKRESDLIICNVHPPPPPPSGAAAKLITFRFLQQSSVPRPRISAIYLHN